MKWLKINSLKISELKAKITVFHPKGKCIDNLPPALLPGAVVDYVSQFKGVW